MDDDDEDQDDGQDMITGVAAPSHYIHYEEPAFTPDKTFYVLMTTRRTTNMF